jgi:hypothetical protein
MSTQSRRDFLTDLEEHNPALLSIGVERTMVGSRWIFER